MRKTLDGLPQGVKPPSALLNSGRSLVVPRMTAPIVTTLDHKDGLSFRSALHGRSSNHVKASYLIGEYKPNLVAAIDDASAYGEGLAQSTSTKTERLSMPSVTPYYGNLLRR
jgi:hypothetical protein